MKKEKVLKRVIISVILAVLLLLNITILVGCNYSDKEVDSLRECGTMLCDDIMSKKLGQTFRTTTNKELYDFTREFNYLLCYDKELDCYAIINMNSGSIMERSSGNVYEGYLNYKCYYGGFNSYFYENDNDLYNIADGSLFTSIDEAVDMFKDYSINLMDMSIEESKFKCKEDIKNYVDTEL